MGLSLYPYRAQPLDAPDNLPSGKTHQNDSPCPFGGDPTDERPCSCSLRGRWAADSLCALDEYVLADRMYDDMCVEDAFEFAKKLRKIANRREQRDKSRRRPSRGSREEGSSDADVVAPTVGSDPTIEEAVTAIREAADWYEKIARLGFDVSASF